MYTDWWGLSHNPPPPLQPNREALPSEPLMSKEGYAKEWGSPKEHMGLLLKHEGHRRLSSRVLLLLEQWHLSFQGHQGSHGRSKGWSFVADTIPAHSFLGGPLPLCSHPWHCPPPAAPTNARLGLGYNNVMCVLMGVLHCP